MGQRSIWIGMTMASVASLVVGCSTKVCTTRGCTDGFTAAVQRADGSFPSGVHRVEILADQAALTCTFPFPPVTLPSGGTAVPSCPFGLSVNVGPVQICTEIRTGNAVGLKCDPVPGQFVETLTLQGTPAQVHAWQYVDDAAILDAAIVPSYENVSPNGPECEPICRQASTSWTLEN